MTQMTPHFTLEEFACRDGTPYPRELVKSRLLPLCNVLEVLRDVLGGKRVTINSGYRSPAYNKRIGGAKFSRHVLGDAADIVMDRVSPSVVHATLLQLHNEQQLRLGGLGAYPTFTHVDVRPGSRLVRWSGVRAEN